MTASQTTRPTITRIVVSTYSDSVVPDSEYRESDPTYPRSMWDAATERVIASLKATYPEAVIDTDDTQGYAFAGQPTIEADGEITHDDEEAVRWHVDAAWQTALEDPEVIAIGAPAR